MAVGPLWGVRHAVRFGPLAFLRGSAHLLQSSCCMATDMRAVSRLRRCVTFWREPPASGSHSSVSVVQAALGADMHHLALQDWQGLVFGRFWLEILGFVGWDRENRSALFSYPPPPNVSLWSTCRTKGIRTDEFDSR